MAGVYWWRAVNRDNLEDSLHHLEFASRNGITDIFISVSDLVNVAGDITGSVDNGSFSANRMASSIVPMQEFVRAASERGITVYALFGSGGSIIIPNSSSRGNFDRRIFGLRVFNNISAYDQRITGIQFNIEPHQLDDWRGDDTPERAMRRHQLLQMKMDFAEEVTDKFSDEFRIDWCMPFWWDGRDGYVIHRGIPNVPLYRALIAEGDRILVMSFRDTAERMYRISDHIVAYARKHNVPVFLMATINESTGPQTRFLEAGKIEMYYELNRLRDIVDYDLLGVSIHHIFSWYPLQYERIPN